MTNHPISTRARIAATVAIIAGVLTGALWSAGPLAHVHAGRTELDVVGMTLRSARIDPAIPALTIVAKRLSAAEKRQDMQDMQVACETGMPKASGVALGPAPADGAF